jgi:hypothetical protein
MRLRILPLVVTAFVVPVFAGAAEPVEPIRLKAKAKVREAWSAKYQDSRYGPEVTERFTKSSKVGRDGTLDLQNIAGDIIVTGGNGDEIRIEAVKRARARDDADARQLLDELRIEVIELGNRVEVRTQYPRNRRNYSGSVDYTITMPTGGSATLRSVSGDVRVTNIRGEVRAESVSGNMVANGATRLSLVKTVSGDIDVTNGSSEGEVTVSTVSGDLTARSLKARALDLSSVSGDVILTDVVTDRAMVKTVSGGIEYFGPLLRNGRYEMTAHSGAIRLAVPNTSGFDLEATTFNGDVRSDFPLTLRDSMGDHGKGLGGLNRSIRGSFGDASAIVLLKSFSGDIVITKR